MAAQASSEPQLAGGQTPEDFVAQLVKTFRKSCQVQKEEAEADYPTWIVKHLKKELIEAAEAGVRKIRLGNPCTCDSLHVSQHNIRQLGEELQTQFPGCQFEISIKGNYFAESRLHLETMKNENFSEKLASLNEWAETNGTFKATSIEICIPQEEPTELSRKRQALVDSRRDALREERERQKTEAMKSVDMDAIVSELDEKFAATPINPKVELDVEVPYLVVPDLVQHLKDNFPGCPFSMNTTRVDCIDPYQIKQEIPAEHFSEVLDDYTKWADENGKFTVTKITMWL